MKGQRYAALDSIRGFALLNMIAYHTIWDLVYIFGFDWKWYQSKEAYIWQQGICWTFILISGFCWSLGKHSLKRGSIIFIGGVLITVVTLIFMPQDRVIFGVLTLISSCMLIMIVLDKILQRLPSLAGIFVSAVLFLFTRNVNYGYLGFEGVNLIQLPEILYRNLFTTYLGFPERGFYSADYFSVFPWIFLFIMGYFLFRYLNDKNKLDFFKKGNFSGLEWLGRHSFEIYMVHQPIVYLGLEIFL